MSDKCPICKNAHWLTIRRSNEPDKYEELAGIENVRRSWVRCINCGFYSQIRNYPIADLEMIYKKGYRDESFRGESIEQAFNRINAIENNENESRYLWFGRNIRYDETVNVLDVGSGIGVWPNILKKAEFEVDCVEENEDSIDFIYNKLGLKCFRGLGSVYGQYDTVSIIHVLEHIEKPSDFLLKIKTFLRPGGTLFVEVPDSCEFNYLPENHDEFNSCHVGFYDMGSLYRLLVSAGFTVSDMHIERTKQRNLSRVMCLAIN